MNSQLLYPLQPCQQCINCTFDTVVDATAKQNLGNLTPDMQAGSGDNSVCDAAPPSQSRFQHMPAELQSPTNMYRIMAPQIPRMQVHTSSNYVATDAMLKV